MTQDIIYYIMKPEVSSAFSRFRTLLLCLSAILYSSLFTWIIHATSMVSQSQELGALCFVLVLMCSTLLTPCAERNDGILIFCIRVYCIAYACVSTFLVVSILMY